MESCGGGGQRFGLWRQKMRTMNSEPGSGSEDRAGMGMKAQVSGGGWDWTESPAGAWMGLSETEILCPRMN